MSVQQYEEIDWEKDVCGFPGGKEAVRALCAVTEVIEWAEDVFNGYVHLPYLYEKDGLSIKFLPHWDHYEIEGIDLLKPRNEGDVRKAIDAVRALQNVGYRRPLEKGEMYLTARCKCGWREKIIFVVGDEEREGAHLTLEELHDQTGCKENPHLTETH